MKKQRTATSIMIEIVLMFLICFVMAGCSATESEPQTEIPVENSSESMSLEDFGKVIAGSIDDLRLINTEIFTFAEKAEGEVVAVVNGIPLQEREFQLRKSMDAVTPQKRSEKELMEKLIEEKTQLSILKQKNIYLSEQEIADYIAMEQSMEAEAGGEFVVQLCEYGGISEEDYWNVYEKYNVMRILVADKVFQLFLEKEMPEMDYSQAVYSEEIGKKYADWMDKQVKKAKIVYR